MNSPRKSSGFSLVEITLALGILSFSIVSLMGLMSVGLTSFRDSIDTTVESQIAQSILNEKRQTAFETLIDSSSRVETNYYGDEGERVARPDAIYVARVEVNRSVRLPASGTSRFANLSLVRVDVRVANSPGADSARVEEAMDGPSSSVFSAYIPKM